MHVSISYCLYDPLKSKLLINKVIDTLRLQHTTTKGRWVGRRPNLCKRKNRTLAKPRFIHLFIQMSGQIPTRTGRMGLLRSPKVGVRYIGEQTREIQRLKNLRISRTNLSSGTLCHLANSPREATF